MKTPAILAASAAMSAHGGDNGSGLIVPDRSLIPPRALVGLGIRAEAQSPQAMFDELMRTVQALRADAVTNATINGVIDPLIVASEARMNEHISNLEEALQSVQTRLETSGITAGVIGDIPANPEYIANFRTHMRRGENAEASVQAAMSIGSAPDGGYLAPIEWDRSITAQMTQVSPIRANAEVINISTQGFSRLFSVGAPGSGWVGETAARPQTGTPTFVPLTFTVGELYANPAITQIALDDAAINLEAWLGNSVRDEFARQENIAFLAGDGVNKPFGLLTYVTGAANAAKHPLGAIDVTNAASATALDGDDFLNLMGDLPAERSANARFFMNRATQFKIRKLKDTTGNYVWAPGLSADQPASLLGHGITDIPGMPTVATGNIVALFGDMRATYLVIDRVGIRVLRDPYTNKPYVMFYTTKRVGGGVQNPEYMQALKML